MSQSANQTNLNSPISKVVKLLDVCEDLLVKIYALLEPPELTPSYLSNTYLADFLNRNIAHLRCFDRYIKCKKNVILEKLSHRQSKLVCLRKYSTKFFERAVWKKKIDVLRFDRVSMSQSRCNQLRRSLRSANPQIKELHFFDCHHLPRRETSHDDFYDKVKAFARLIRQAAASFLRFNYMDCSGIFPLLLTYEKELSKTHEIELSNMRLEVTWSQALNTNKTGLNITTQSPRYSWINPAFEKDKPSRGINVLRWMRDHGKTHPQNQLLGDECNPEHPFRDKVFSIDSASEWHYRTKIQVISLDDIWPNLSGSDTD